MNNKGQVIIVGGTKGLGLATVERFLNLGYHVTVLSRETPKIQTRYSHIAIDLENMNSYLNIIDNIIKCSGKIQYLIFCQRYRGNGDKWQGELQVSLTATRLIINACVTYFNTTSDCAIAIVSSVYAEFVGGSQPDSYHVAKAGLNQLVKYNAYVLGRQGIRVNSIMPLTYLKPESQDYFLKDEKLMSIYKNYVPLKRIGNAIDSVNLLEFLCSEKASFINGQNIFVDGGVSVIWPEELAIALSNF